MSAAVGGMVRQSETDERVRLWHVGSDRVLRWFGREGTGGVTQPIPGEAPVICCDPWQAFAVLADGSAQNAYGRPGCAVEWISGRRNVISGGRNMSETSSKLIAGWIERRSGMRKIVVVDTERRVLLAAADAPAVVVGGKVPGTAAVLAVAVEGRDQATVLLADGRLLFATPRGWTEVAQLGGEGTPGGVSIKLKALSGWRETATLMVAPGDIFEVGAERASVLMGRHWAEPAENAS